MAPIKYPFVRSRSIILLDNQSGNRCGCVLYIKMLRYNVCFLYLLNVRPRSMLRNVSFIGASILALVGCAGDLCGNTVSQTVASPSGRSRAVVFSRDCGATTGFSTQVSVLDSDDTLPNEGGNMLVLDGTIPIQLRWLSDASLVIAGIGNARVSRQERAVARIDVSYAQ